MMHHITRCIPLLPKVEIPELILCHTVLCHTAFPWLPSSSAYSPSLRLLWILFSSMVSPALLNLATNHSAFATNPLDATRGPIHATMRHQTQLHNKASCTLHSLCMYTCCYLPLIWSNVFLQRYESTKAVKHCRGQMKLCCRVQGFPGLLVLSLINICTQLCISIVCSFN